MAASTKRRSGGERCARLGKYRKKPAIHVQLTPADLGEIDDAFSKVTVHGGRMAESYIRDVDQTK